MSNWFNAETVFAIVLACSLVNVLVVIGYYDVDRRLKRVERIIANIESVLGVLE